MATEKQKEKNLLIVSVICLAIRLFVMFFTNMSGLIFDILWIPPFFLLIFVPFKVISVLFNKVFK